VTSELRVVGVDEPGTPLVVFGQVFGADGRAIHGARILVSHADARGEYGTSPKNPSWARLSGRLQTDSLGRYRVRTVRPGSYGGPAHVHFVISRPWGTEQGFELRFADERQGPPVLPGLAADTGMFAIVRGVVRDAGGVLRVRRDFRLQ
jgi:protocatechuate 3,4-dioxygenase beta subunit